MPGQVRRADPTLALRDPRGRPVAGRAQPGSPERIGSERCRCRRSRPPSPTPRMPRRRPRPDSGGRSLGSAAATACSGSATWTGGTTTGATPPLGSRHASRRVPTVYINSIGMRMLVPGKTEIAWRPYHRKLGSLLKGLRRDEASGLWVYTPLFVPRYSADGRIQRRPAGAASAAAAAVARPAAPLRLRLVAHRGTRRGADDVGEGRLRALRRLHRDARGGRPLDRRPGAAPLERCDHAAYVSRESFDHERDRVADAQFVSHGVDSEHLARARPLDGPRPPAPGAIRDLPRPLVGFFGGMDDYPHCSPTFIRPLRADPTPCSSCDGTPRLEP